MGIKLKIKQAISFLLHGEPDIVQVNLATLAPNELLKGRCALITGGTVSYTHLTLPTIA